MTYPDPAHPISVPRPTLASFLREHMVSVPARLGGLVHLIEEIAAACGQISAEVGASSHGEAARGDGRKNSSGDAVAQLDLIADRLLAERLAHSGYCAGYVSEEREEPHVFADSDAAYLVVADPLDGSSNIGCALPVGTIFGVLANPDRTRSPSAASFLQPGRALVAAGYAIYGPSTELVLTTDAEVHVFVLEERVWRLARRGLRLPAQGRIYSINEANSQGWEPEALRSWVEDLKAEGYTQRYVGSLVADVHRTLLKGGVFLYPGDTKNPQGKLRHLYEGAPMARIFEAAGGRGTTGARRVLDVVPVELHERSPLVLGSSREVLELQRILGGAQRRVRVGRPRGVQVACTFEHEGQTVRGQLRLSPQSRRHQFSSS